MSSKKNIHYPLLPLSILYGAGVYFRNKLFDFGILKSERFDIPIICVGNLTVGGTGKTPHIEYLIRILQNKYRIAVLSRGYKRRSRGFQLATTNSDANQMGDEPYQIYSKFPTILVAVDADRRNGIRQLMQLQHPPQVILLDDAYQHRYVDAGLKIVLTDYNRMIYNDTLLPAGRLRENQAGLKRADLIITTKCAEDPSEQEQRTIAQKLKLRKEQNLFFSGLHYGTLKNVFGINHMLPNSETAIFMVTGIAQPSLFEKYLKMHYNLTTTLTFPDHHNFDDDDIRQIELKFNQISNKEKAIIVTEKDAVRLLNNPALSDKIKAHLYFLPLEIVILNSQTTRFNQIILDYVAENQRNS